MGNYNGEYESYYAKILQRKREQNPYAAYGVQEPHNRESGISSIKNINSINSNFFTKRIMQELLGVLCLTAFVIACKTVSTPETTIAYKYAKDIVNNNIDYSKFVDPKIAGYISSLDFKDAASVRDKLEDSIETFKANVTGGKTLKEKAKESFVSPVKGTINAELSSKQKDKALIIEVKENTEVMAPNGGAVKKTGEDKENGAYVLIDHGDGIESKCSGIKDISVKEGDKVEKGQFLGKSTTVKSLNKACIIFSLSYMGEDKDPKEYVTFD
ncbi:M23 family metallopeptidase [Clostridium sp. C8-1-8]|uniref:M23 family metallopeptidase n=1 Tax=Clostridium sp. C8-1-8 TaxID=2698831 RepID=UPI00136BCF57|nr:M23 family metallopeptidase [Clostridium sp. C8-1-8]